MFKKGDRIIARSDAKGDEWTWNKGHWPHRNVIYEVLETPSGEDVWIVTDEPRWFDSERFVLYVPIKNYTGKLNDFTNTRRS